MGAGMMAAVRTMERVRALHPRPCWHSLWRSSPARRRWSPRRPDATSDRRADGDAFRHAHATPTPTPTPTATPAEDEGDPQRLPDFSEDGVIAACDYTAKLLEQTLETITPQRDADYPDFRRQSTAAIKAHEQGDVQAEPTPTPAPTSTPAPSTAAAAPPSSGGSTPAPAPAPAPGARPSRARGRRRRPGQAARGARRPYNGTAVPPPASPAVPPAATPAPVPPVASAPQEPQIVVGHGQDDGSMPVAADRARRSSSPASPRPARRRCSAARGRALRGHAARRGARRPTGPRGTWGDFTDWLRLGR